MIVLRNLTKIFQMHGQRKIVADNINATFPTGVSVGLLGRNGAGKSTLLRMIAGTTHATSGEVLSTGTISFPVGLANSLHPDLTGSQNTRFVARIYGADTDALMAYVEDFAELGSHFHLPVRSYSSGMRGRLSFGINMGLKFDTYLIDEVTAVGDASFKRKSRDVFLDRMSRAGAIYVSHSMGSVRELCSAGALLEDGKLSYYADVEEAIDRYMRSLDGGQSYAPVPDLPGGKAAANFPGDARMLFGLGLPQTGADWLGDCLRRHRPCHFGPEREPHYFDIRAGFSTDVLERRTRSARLLSDRMGAEDGPTRRNTVRLLREVGGLLAMHAAPIDGPDRHEDYINLLLTGRKSQPVLCDFTPTYCQLGRDDFAEMSAIGGARFMVMLRDPATRLWAQIRDRLPARNQTGKNCVAAARKLLAGGALAEDPGQWPEADYIRLLTELDAVVMPERLFIAFHERLSDPKTLEDLCAFIEMPVVPKISRPDLPEDPLPEMPADIRDGLRRLLAPQYAAMQARFGSDLPAEWGPVSSGAAMAGREDADPAPAGQPSSG